MSFSNLAVDFKKKSRWTRNRVIKSRVNNILSNIFAESRIQSQSNNSTTIIVHVSAPRSPLSQPSCPLINDFTTVENIDIVNCDPAEDSSSYKSPDSQILSPVINNNNHNNNNPSPPPFFSILTSHTALKNLQEHPHESGNEESSFLCSWALRNNITHTALSELLKWFSVKPNIENLPLDARTLLNTPKSK